MEGLQMYVCHCNRKEKTCSGQTRTQTWELPNTSGSPVGRPLPRVRQVPKCKKNGRMQ